MAAKYFAQCLLGRNLTQTIMLLPGCKGTLTNILELIVELYANPAVVLKRVPSSAKTLLRYEKNRGIYFRTSPCMIKNADIGIQSLIL